MDYGPNNTYKALRVVGLNYSLYYSVWCTNEHELYDLTVRAHTRKFQFSPLTWIQTDPGQLNNIYPSSFSESKYEILGIPLSKVLPRLDALLMVTKSCKGYTCVDPWSVIHPPGNVKTLADALNKRFDPFYASVSTTVSFERCELGYILESEGPQNAVVFQGELDDWLDNSEL